MREIVAKKLTETVKDLCLEANTNLSDDVVEALNKAMRQEKSPTGREILRQLINNARAAWRDKLPICQDTGLAFVFISLGQEVNLVGGDLNNAVNEGVRQAYEDGLFRKSTVNDPLNRQNTGDNRPAQLHVEIVPGDKIGIDVLTKGGGAENCSAVKMFRPYADRSEIDQFILETIRTAGPNACPPMVIGIGVGGSFSSVALLAKQALLREIGVPSGQSETAKWEKDLLEQINRMGIGPMGLGGTTTALAVHIERRPCHISSLPVALNIECHAHRYKHAEI